MPKMKTHKGTAKRVKVTGSGKISIRTPNPKRSKRQRSDVQKLKRNVIADKTVARAIRKNLPYENFEGRSQRASAEGG